MNTACADTPVTVIVFIANNGKLIEARQFSVAPRSSVEFVVPSINAQPEER